MAPIDPYDATKMVCERMLEECALAFPLSFISLRYFNAAGADPECEIGECHVPETHAIPLLLDVAARESTHFTIYGDDYPTADGTCVRDYIHVTDLADAHVKARGWSVRELVAAVREITGSDFVVQVGARRVGDPPALVADASHARHQLGWRPRYPDLSTQVMGAWAWRQGDRQTWKRMQAQQVKAC
jgi:UDP-glucose 4-epimerase